MKILLAILFVICLAMMLLSDIILHDTNSVIVFGVLAIINNQNMRSEED